MARQQSSRTQAFTLFMATGFGLSALLIVAALFILGDDNASRDRPNRVHSIPENFGGDETTQMALDGDGGVAATRETSSDPSHRETRGAAGIETTAPEASPRAVHGLRVEQEIALRPQDRAQTAPALDAFEAPFEEAWAKRASISGRVLDETGQPLPGVELQASAIRLFEHDEASNRATAPEVHYAVSDFAGWYEFWDLAEGEYRIQTTPMGPFVSAHKMVRTGVRSANLVLSWQQEVTVFGVVRGQHGEPLEGVQVTGLSSPPRVVYTDWQGQYEIALSLREKAPHSAVHFKRAGYREQRLKVEVAGANAGFEEIKLDATLEPFGALATVGGSIKDSSGRPVSGETVSLTSHSVGRGFQGVSDRGGKFSIPNVEPASDYRLLVAARGAYQDYKKSGVEVAARGLTLNIVLEPLATGRIEGQMVDLEGNPIPNFSLTMKSQTALRHSVQVSGDSQGFFVVTDVPQGPVKLRTESTPRIVVSGLRASQGVEDPVTVMLDLGEHELRGWITDTRGQPVATARINARMEHIAKGVRSFSARDAISDAEGYFEFSGLGAGIHTVRVSATGFATIEFDTDVGRDDAELVIALENE